MVHFLRHISCRIWFTLPVGFVACLFLLPLFEPVTGLSGLIYPAAAVAVGVYVAAGRLGNRIGRLLMARLIREAEIWERGGETRRAEAALRRALSIYDSFLISPLERKRSGPAVGGSMARFYLAAAHTHDAGEAFVDAYLNARPGDREVAEAWLLQMEGGMKKGGREQETALRIGKAQQDNPAVQASLAGIYLAWGRNDFSALQTYRKVMAQGGRAAAEVAQGLSRLFLSRGRADHLALHVYLSAYRAGSSGEELLRGIAASVNRMEETRAGSPLKERGKKLLAGIDGAVKERLQEGLNPPYPAADERQHPEGQGAERGTGFGRAVLRLLERAGASLLAFGGFTCRFLKAGSTMIIARCRKITKFEYTGRFLAFSAVAAVVVLFSFLVVNTANHLAGGGRQVKEKFPVPERDSADRFTIQVAAYLTPVHARAFVARLNALNVDAYWNEVSGEEKRWFQVRVSHFSTRDAAKGYGEQLKAKGIIDDFYVANRKAPKSPLIKKRKEIIDDE